MVATRGMSATVAAVTGPTPISASSISPEDWAVIVQSFVAKLPLKKMSGFQHASAILEGWLKKGVNRYHDYTHSKPLWLGEITMAPGKGPLAGQFLSCSVLGEGFPDRWEGASRVAATREGEESKLAIVTTRNLVLSREGDFSVIEASWHPREEWDDSLSSRPAHFWYELESRSVVRVSLPVEGRWYTTFSADSSVARVARDIIRLCREAIKETRQDIAIKDRVMEDAGQMAGDYEGRIDWFS